MEASQHNKASSTSQPAALPLCLYSKASALTALMGPRTKGGERWGRVPIAKAKQHNPTQEAKAAAVPGDRDGAGPQEGDGHQPDARRQCCPSMLADPVACESPGAGDTESQKH